MDRAQKHKSSTREIREDGWLWIRRILDDKVSKYYVMSNLSEIDDYHAVHMMSSNNDEGFLKNTRHKK